MKYLRILVVAVAAAAFAAAAASADVSEQGPLVVSFKGGLSPTRLPRVARAPVSVSLNARIRTSDGSQPPNLRRISVEINRHGHLYDRGLATCPPRRIEVATSAQALARCRAALVGSGRLTARVAVPERAPFPADGKILAFNGRLHGKRVVYAQIFGRTKVVRPSGTAMVPTSYLLPFKLRRSGRGKFGLVLSAKFPYVASDWGFLTRFDLRLGRTYRRHGRRHGYINANCPAPPGFPGASFTFARARYLFSDGKRLSSTLLRSCRVRR